METLSRAEDRAADAHMRRAEFDGDFEIAAHAHRQDFDSVARGDLVEQSEMRRGLLIDRRDAHEARNIELQIVAAIGDKVVRLFRQDLPPSAVRRRY